MPKHILFIFTDQQRRDTIRALGNENIQTPSLDAIANTSTVYENAITPSPVCVPARLSMYAGQYPARTGCNNNYKDLAYKGDGFYSELTRAGWQTCAVGKMHHSSDPYSLMGFTKRYTQEEMSHPDDDYTKYIKENYPYVFDYNGQRSEFYYVPQVSQLPAEAHPTQWVGDRSIDFLDEADPEKNVFLMASFIHPHPPFCPPAPWNKLYRDDLELPFRPEGYEKLKKLVSKSLSCERMCINDRELIRLKNSYYACISFVDYQIGRIVAKLKEKGMYEDTMIVFSTDHGELLGDYDNMGKRSMLDAAAHIPLLIHMPGQTERVYDNTPVSLVDIAPTFLDYAGIGYDKAEYDGLSILGEDKHEYVYSQYSYGKKGAYMVYDGQYKLVYNGPEDRYYFFDSYPEAEDKFDPENEEVKRLKRLLDAYKDSDVVKGEDRFVYNFANRKRYPNQGSRMDHDHRHEEEAARIPEGYTIDLG